MHHLNESGTVSQTHHIPEQKRPLQVNYYIEDNIDHFTHTPHQSAFLSEGHEQYMKEKSYRTLKSFDQTTHRYKIKRNMWNIINIGECERRSEIDSASTTFGNTISKNYRSRDV